MIRLFIFSIAIFCTGWGANDLSNSINMQRHKAAVCDETKCLDIKQMASDLEGMKLPVKGE